MSPSCMVWLSGLFSLEVTTSTPQALCPPLEDARAAVQARVGEVQGQYEAEFALVRVDDGGQVLHLVVRDQERMVVLERDIPMGAEGCHDAAQALALVLERYFDALDEAPSSEPGTSTSAKIPTPPAAAAASQPTDQPPPRIPTSLRGEPAPWRVRVGLLADRDYGVGPVLGIERFPSWLALRPGLGFGLTLDAAVFVNRITETVRDRDVRASTLQAALAVPFAVREGDLLAAVGPALFLRGQMASGGALSGASRAYRLLPALGARAQLGWRLSEQWSAGLEGGAGVQLRDATTRFVLEKEGGESVAVLVPSTSLLQAQLNLVWAL